MNVILKLHKTRDALASKFAELLEEPNRLHSKSDKSWDLRNELQYIFKRYLKII